MRQDQGIEGGGGGLESAHSGRRESCVRLQRDRPAGLCVFVLEKATSAEKRSTHFGGQPPGTRSTVTRSEAQVVGYLTTIQRVSNGSGTCLGIADSGRGGGSR
jgi:hypothetical protein